VLPKEGGRKPAVAAQQDKTTYPSPKPSKPQEADENIPSTLGGYQVIKELGRGGMGAVYLARQVSLDRPVALKVMNQRCATDPVFVARFTREAYAAAQLTHHNVVPIYDIGAHKGTHFFSMEYVKGQSLMDLVREHGRLDAEAAVGYVLQAARGLAFGHQMGLVHRDVKPDNLLLSEHGIVKVADLGLVKITAVADPGEAAAEGKPGRLAPSLSTNITRAGKTMGTPTYMAPEQARSASEVDSRADIYSLGCTLYALLTGKPPFEGKTVLEVLTKHASEPIVPPDVLVKRVPKELSAILLKMLAKKPEDRYPDMKAVIEALEKFLGIHHTGVFSPREEHAVLLEKCVKKFNEAPGVRLRSRVIVGFFACCAVLVLACLLFGWLVPAGGVLGLAVMTPLSYFLVQGWMEKSYLYLKVRELVLGCGWSDLLYWIAAGTLFVLVLFLVHLLWIWIAFGLTAFVLGAGLYFLADRRLAAQRAAPIETAEKLFRSMRLQGLEEQALRQFVCKYSGRHWEGFYEALFGYEAKVMAREWVRGEAARSSAKFAAWRDSLVAWIDARQQARKEARERRLLQAVEAKALQAKGLEAAEANQKAAQMAEVMVTRAAEIKKEAAQPASPENATVPHAALRDLLETAREPETFDFGPASEMRPLRPRTGLFTGLLGAKLRFLAGAILITVCLLWMYQNRLLEEDNLQKLFAEIIKTQDFQKLEQRDVALWLPGVPTNLTQWFSGFYPGIAGLVLLLSAFFGGWRMSLLVWPAAVLALFGPVLGIPALGPLSPALVSMAGALVLWVLAVLFLRD
jgi:hypothetical protein